MELTIPSLYTKAVAVFLAIIENRGQRRTPISPLSTSIAMLGKKPQPVIGKLAGNQAWFSDAATSPTSPLEYKIQSPRGLKSYDLGGVGLAIVAALEKSDSPRNQIQANKALFVQNSTRSNPIPVKPTRTTYNRGDLEESEMDSLEDYTFVTCHGPNKSYTRVYCDNGSDHGRIGHEKVGFDRRSKNYGLPVFEISPAGFGGDHFPAHPASDFLSSCNLCRKKLHGRDIYMYRYLLYTLYYHVYIRRKHGL